MKKIALWLMLCVLFGTLAGAQVNVKAISVASSTKAVRVGSTASLQVEPAAELTAGLTFQWSAQRGLILGSGSNVSYSAPSGLNPGFDVISVVISGLPDGPVKRYAVVFVYKQFVVLKADDYVCWDYLAPEWKYYLEYMAQRHIKTSAGIVAQCTEPSWNDLPGYADFVQYTKDQSKTRYVEFWNHGYDHSLNEFVGKTYAVQKSHLDQAQALGRNVLGITFTAFDAPFNENDATTVQVVNENTDIAVWMYAQGTGSTKLVLSRDGGEIESSTGVPSWSTFSAGYAASAPVIVLQHHPGHQSFKDRFAQFEQIINFLIEQKTTFIQPTEYAKLVRQGLFPLEPSADSDGDGKVDVVEGQGDADGDGLPEFLDADAPDPDPKAVISLAVNNVAVRSDQSVQLAVQCATGLDPDWSYQWSASTGSLTPAGSSATYRPPDPLEPGNAMVTVTVTKQGTTVATCSKTLLLYRQIILLKADDWVRDPDYYMGVGTRWDSYINYLRQRNIKTSVGLIANSLDPEYPYPGANKWSEFVEYSKAAWRTGLVDFFNHGYDHSGGADWAEFWNMDYAFQKNHLEMGNQLARNVLGIPLTGFGAPFNSFDTNTAKVVDESTDTQVWIFGPVGGSSKIVLDRMAGEIEPFAVGTPDFAGFLQGYDAAAPCAVLQHHPNSPQFTTHFSEFEQIITYLLNQKATFMTFNDYFLLTHEKVVPGAQSDTDNDGIPDSVEGTGDSDGDGIPNYLDPDVPPSIATQPAGTAVDVGASFTLTVVAGGTNPLSYQWYKDGVSIAGATGSSYTVSSATASDGGNYTVRVSNRAGDYLGNPVSSQALVTVNVPQSKLPIITLTGQPNVTVEAPKTYVDAGATARDYTGADITSRIVVTGSVNSNVIGVYTLTYNVTDSYGNAAVPVTRTVSVVDTTKPVITRLGNATVTVQGKTTYTDAGATASDNYDGNITSRIITTGTVNTSVLGTYTLTYNVSDSSDNAATPVSRTVKVVDTIKPVITMLGNSKVTIKRNSQYTDAGATASDNFDGNLTSKIAVTTNVNTSRVGTYYVRYNVKDSSGNAAAQKSRTVIVTL